MGITYREMKGRRVTGNDEKCNGCLICQLRCSFRFEKAFNPLRAAIKVDRFAEEEGKFYISFTERCDVCGICAIHCPYGALEFVKEKEEG